MPSLPAPPPAQMPSELAQAVAAAHRLTAGLRVPGKLNQPHRIVAGWLEERQRAHEHVRRHS